MSNAILLLITQQRQRRKNSKPRPQYVHACVIRRHVRQYVCVHIAEDAGSSAGKVNWALCWVKAYSAQTKGPIKEKKKSLLLAAEKPNTERWCLPRSLRLAAWMITNGDFKRAHDSRSWVRLFPLRSKMGGETTLEGCELTQTRGDAICTTDISSEHSLRTCTQVRRNVRKSDGVYACNKKKKNATEVTVPDLTQRSLHRPGPPMCSPFVLVKRDHVISSPFF